MIDVNELKRGNRILCRTAKRSPQFIGVVLSIAKTSVRVYNIDDDQYVNLWIDAEYCDPLKLSHDEILELGGHINKTEGGYSFKDGPITVYDNQLGWDVWVYGICVKPYLKYSHELDNLVSVWNPRLNVKSGERAKNNIRA